MHRAMAHLWRMEYDQERSNALRHKREGTSSKRHRPLTTLISSNRLCLSSHATLSHRMPSNPRHGKRHRQHSKPVKHRHQHPHLCDLRCHQSTLRNHDARPRRDTWITSLSRQPACRHALVPPMRLAHLLATLITYKPQPDPAQQVVESAGHILPSATTRAKSSNAFSHLLSLPSMRSR